MQAASSQSWTGNLALILVAGAFGLGITYIQFNPQLVTSAVDLIAGTTTTEQKAEPATQQGVAPAESKPAEATPKEAPKTESTQPDAAVSSPPTATPAVKTATTVSFVNVRAGKSTSTPIIMNLEAGTVVQLTEDSNASWQGVTHNGKTGYIFKDYLQKQ